MKHCKTCKHFRAVYPQNAQLGNCIYLQVSDNQPCGHMISGRPIASSFFKETEKQLCINRVMDDFGCVYHQEKD